LKPPGLITAPVKSTGELIDSAVPIYARLSVDERRSRAKWLLSEPFVIFFGDRAADVFSIAARAERRYGHLNSKAGVHWMKGKKQGAVGDGMDQAIRRIAERLAPLYDGSGADRPDALLHDAPNADRTVEALRVLEGVIFPGRVQEEKTSDSGPAPFFFNRIKQAVELLRPEMERALPYRWTGASAVQEQKTPEPCIPALADQILEAFIVRLPEVRAMLVEDVRAAYNGDPAALSFAEVKLAYPGLTAVAAHRIAHELYRLEVPILPRIMSEYIHGKTGIDIHPGARIGHGFFIDHGTGVVIGETCRIGNHVKLYQGVTLGAKSFPLDENGNPVKHIQRHPTVGSGAVIYANATILGGDTVIGENSTVGGNVFLMQSIPPGSLVTRNPEGISIKNRGGDAQAWMNSPGL